MQPVSNTIAYNINVCVGTHILAPGRLPHTYVYVITTAKLTLLQTVLINYMDLPYTHAVVSRVNTINSR